MEIAKIISNLSLLGILSILNQPINQSTKEESLVIAGLSVELKNEASGKENQFGFMQKRSTSKDIFVLKTTDARRL